MPKPIGQLASSQADTVQLVKQYLPLVRQIAKRYSRVNPEAFEDLLQVGCVGLLKACKTYDPNREGKASFKTFALVYIKGEIRHYLRDHGSLVQMPRRLNEISSKISQLEETMHHELERVPTPEELSARSGYSVDDVREAMHSWEACTRMESLDGGDDADGREDTRAMCEMVPDRRHADAQTSAEERELVAQALKNVGEKTRQIIEFVYFYDLTQKETAQILGLSEMGVSRTLRRALAKLKDILFTEIF
ncbi:MAG TPA: sigma-70 family RNA polymerase sigma factor [Candidatus Obscuribacterales bacterium]